MAYNLFVMILQIQKDKTVYQKFQFRKKKSFENLLWTIKLSIELLTQSKEITTL